MNGPGLPQGQEDELNRELSRLGRERGELRGRSELERMLEARHRRHLARAGSSATEALRFQRLSQRISEAVGAQAELVDRLARGVQRPEQAANVRNGGREL